MSTAPERDSMEDLPWPEPKGPCTEVSRAIREQCTRDLCPKRRMSTWYRAGVSLLLSVLVIGATGYLTRNHERPPGAVRAALFAVTGWLSVQGPVLVVGLTPAGRRAGRGARIAMVIAVPLSFFGYLQAVSHYSMPVDEFVGSTKHAGWAAGCGFFTFLFGAAAAACMVAVWRRTDPMTPRLSGAFVGLLGGITAALAAGCACPSQEGLHLLVAHGFVVLSLVALGGLAGRRFISP